MILDGNIDFFQGLISGTGVFLGFTLASQITILSSVFDKSKSNSASASINTDKGIIFCVFSWLFVLLSIILSCCLWYFHLATAPENGITGLVEELAKYVESAYGLYFWVLVLTNIIQIISAIYITALTNKGCEYFGKKQRTEFSKLIKHKEN